MNADTSDHLVGISIEELETPAVVIDLDVVASNSRRLMTYADEHGLAVWPHTKTHKIPGLAKRQLDDGAAGLTVAKTTEALALVDAGLGPLFVHYPPHGSQKWERLAHIAARTPLTVAVDSYESVGGLNDALTAIGASVEILIEVDVGYDRTGVRGSAAAVALAKRVDGLGNVETAGISIYPGHARMATQKEVAECLSDIRAVTSEVIEDFDRAGLRRERVSGGTTPSLFLSHKTPVTEIRPGTYLLLDRSEASYDVYSLEECAARVATTVVSVHGSRAVIDAGSKTLSEAPFHGFGEHSGYGFIVGHPESIVVKLDEEHGVCDAGENAAWSVGDRVELVPNHICATMNLHDTAFGIRSGVVESVFDVAGRGRIH